MTFSTRIYPRICTALLVAICSPLVLADGAHLRHSESECPSLEHLNSTTLHWHLIMQDRMARMSSFQQLVGTTEGKPARFDRDIRPAETSNDQQACEHINSYLIGLLARSRHIIRDRETDRLVNSFYWMIYRVNDRMIAIISPYSPGDDQLEMVGGPSGGYTTVIRFNQNLEEVERISF